MAADFSAGRVIAARWGTRAISSFVRGASALRAFLLVVAMFAVASSARAEWEPIPAEAWNEPSRPDSGGGDAIMLLDRSVYHDDQGRSRYEYFGRARVFTPDGRDIGNIEIDYLRGRSNIENLRARSVQPNGRVTEFDPTQLVESTALKYGDFDLVRASVAVPGIEPGCIVEWAYTIAGKSEEFGSWRFRFSNEVYTCVSTHTWHSSRWWKEELTRSWKYSGIHPVFVEEKCEPNREHPQTVTFTLLRVPGVKGEELAPPAEDASPRVTVFYGDEETTGYWSFWKRGFDAYQEEIGKDLGGLKDLIRDLRARHPDPESALAAAFYWVQGHVRSLRDLPWDRRPSEEKTIKSYKLAKSIGAILERSEALPVEINFLMVAAARELGLEAVLGFVGDRRYGNFDHKVRGFPPSNFVTVVNLPGGTVFLSPDSRFAPFESIPWYYRGGQCLLSGRTMNLFLKISPDAGELATVNWKLQLRLDPEGVLDGRIDARLLGEEAADWKRELWGQDPKNWKRYLEDRLAEHDGPKTTFEIPALGTPPDSEFVLRATARWPSIAAVAGDRVMVPLDRLIPWRTRARFLAENRKQSVLFRHPRAEVIRASIHLSPGMTVEHLPEPQEFSNDIGSWSVRWSYQAGLAKVERRLEVNRAEIPPQEYRAVRELFRGLEQADQTVLLVSKQP